MADETIMKVLKQDVPYRYHQESIFQDRQFRFQNNSPLRSQSQFCPSNVFRNSSVTRARILSKIEMLDSLNKVQTAKICTYEKIDRQNSCPKHQKSDILSKVAQLVKKLQHKELPHKMIEAAVLSRKTSVPQNTKLLLQQEHIAKQITITQRVKGKPNITTKCIHHDLLSTMIQGKSSDTVVEQKPIHPKLPSIKQQTFSRSLKNMNHSQKIIVSYGNNNNTNNVCNTNESRTNLKSQQFNNLSNLLKQTDSKTVTMSQQFLTKSYKPLPIPDQSNLSLSGWTDRTPIN